MKIAIIENSKGLGKYFAKFIKQSKIFPVWKNSKFPKDFHAYIFTGDFNNISDGLLPYHKKEIEFIKSLDKKIFASCFSHQLFAKIFGGKVVKRKERFFGWHKIQTKKHPIFKGLKNPAFFSVNGDEVKKPKAKILATNKDCKYQILQYGKNIITCQSHPEILKKEAMTLIKKHRKGLLNRCKNLDELAEQTEKLANDKDNRIFMSNIKKWLIS